MRQGACAGECCRSITLNVSDEETAKRAALYKLHLGMGGEPHWGGYDAVFVAENFIPMRQSYDCGITGNRWPDGNKPRWQYRCRYWTGQKCSAYELRPGFCREYGEWKACTVKGCTLRVFDLSAEVSAWESEGGYCPSENPPHA